MLKFINLKKLSANSFLAILISGGLAIKSNAAPAIQAPTTPVPTRTLVNPSFEYPAFTGSTWKSLDSYIPGNNTTLQGWFSTHPTTGYPGYGTSQFKDAQGNPFRHLVELWVNNFNNVPAPQGNQFAELNAQANSALYQDILVFSNEQIPWSAAHRAREKNGTASSIPDIAEVSISDPLNWSGATFSGTKLYSATLATSVDNSTKTITPILGQVTNAHGRVTLSNGWIKYSDTWAGPSTSKRYRFAFQSLSSSSGDLTYGNFLDDIQIKLSPVVDLADPNIAEINPGSNSIYYLPVRMNGQSKSTATVEIDVSLAGNDYTNYALGALASGNGGAVANGVTAAKLENGNIRVTVPAKLYDPNNPSDYISVPINFNQASAGQDKLARFSIVNVTGGGGDGVQNLLIPPADSATYGFATARQTTVKAGFSD